jgi:hypothetical protein
MVTADLVRAVLAVALVFLSGHVIAVYLIAFGLSAGAVLFNPAACGETCPTFPGKRYEDWSVDDPAGQDIETVGASSTTSTAGCASCSGSLE